MKKFIWVYILLTISVSLAMGQQSVKFSNYLFNKTTINPAAAGSNEYFEVIGSYRSQWAAVEGAPTTAFLTADGVFLDKRIGASIQVMDDRLGALAQNGIIANLATRLRTSESGWLSFGFAAGLFTSTLRGDELTVEEEGDQALPEARVKQNLMDFKAGVYYKDYRYFGGISVFNVLEPKLNYTPSSRSAEGALAQHFYFFGGRVFTISKDLNLVPSVLYKTDNEWEGQLDLNAKLIYNNQVALGVAYRNQESVGVLAEYIHNDLFRIGYAYDFHTHGFSDYQSGAHEVMLSYRFIQNKEILENPRYFYH